MQYHKVLLAPMQEEVGSLRDGISSREEIERKETRARPTELTLQPSPSRYQLSELNVLLQLSEKDRPRLTCLPASNSHPQPHYQHASMTSKRGAFMSHPKH